MKSFRSLAGPLTLWTCPVCCSDPERGYDSGAVRESLARRHGRRSRGPARYRWQFSARKLSRLFSVQACTGKPASQHVGLRQGCQAACGGTRVLLQPHRPCVRRPLVQSCAMTLHACLVGVRHEVWEGACSAAHHVWRHRASVRALRTPTHDSRQDVQRPGRDPPPDTTVLRVCCDTSSGGAGRCGAA